MGGLTTKYCFDPTPKNRTIAQHLWSSYLSLPTQDRQYQPSLQPLHENNAQAGIPLIGSHGRTPAGHTLQVWVRQHRYSTTILLPSPEAFRTDRFQSPQHHFYCSSTHGSAHTSLGPTCSQRAATPSQYVRSVHNHDFNFSFLCQFVVIFVCCDLIAGGSVYSGGGSVLRASEFNGSTAYSTHTRTGMATTQPYVAKRAVYPSSTLQLYTPSMRDPSSSVRCRVCPSCLSYGPMYADVWDGVLQ